MGKSIWKKLILPSFIIFIMVMSGVGYMAGKGSDDVVKYKGYKFSKINNVWQTYKDDRQIILFNNPNDLDGIEIDYVDFEYFNLANKIYFSANPEDNLGIYLQSLQFNLLDNLAGRKVFACYESNEACTDYPLKDCDDASSSVKVILVKKDERTEINYKDDCLVIKGHDAELIKYIDKLILNMFIE